MHNCSELLNTINGETGAGETGARMHFSHSVGIYLNLCPPKYIKNRRNSFSYKEMFINTINGGNYILQSAKFNVIHISESLDFSLDLL